MQGSDPIRGVCVWGGGGLPFSKRTTALPWPPLEGRTDRQPAACLGRVGGFCGRSGTGVQCGLMSVSVSRRYPSINHNILYRPSVTQVFKHDTQTAINQPIMRPQSSHHPPAAAAMFLSPPVEWLLGLVWELQMMILLPPPRSSRGLSL
jgi:hypothetical protein